MAKSARPPACHDCNGPHARWVPVGHEHVWLCVDCEYQRRYVAGVAAAVAMPWDREPAPLQRETLF